MCWHRCQRENAMNTQSKSNAGSGCSSHDLFAFAKVAADPMAFAKRGDVFRGYYVVDGVSPWISILELTSGRWMVEMPHGQTAKVSVSGSGLSRHGAWRRREADFRREGRSRIVFALAGAGLPKPRLAGACVGADGKSFPSAAGNARAEPIGRDGGLAGNFQPGVEQPLSAAGACVPRALQGGAGGGRAGGGRALLQKRGGLL